MVKNKIKLAFLVAHPVQYFSPFFRILSKNNDIEITVLYMSDEGKGDTHDNGFGINIDWGIDMLGGYNFKILKNHSPCPSTSKIPFGLINLGIIKELQGVCYDAIIVHGWTYVTNIIAILAAGMTKTPLFVRSESTLCQEISKPKWIVFLKRQFMGILLKEASGFLAIGAENREFYRFYRVKDDRIHSMPYSVDNERISAECERFKKSKDSLRSEIGIRPDKVIVLFCGKLVNKKRPMDLISAYEKINTDNKALIFIGDGRLRP